MLAVSRKTEVGILARIQCRAGQDISFCVLNYCCKMKGNVSFKLSFTAYLKLLNIVISNTTAKTFAALLLNYTETKINNKI